METLTVGFIGLGLMGMPMARNVLKDYTPHEGLWPTEYYPAKREASRKKFADILARPPRTTSP